MVMRMKLLRIKRELNDGCGDEDSHTVNSHTVNSHTVIALDQSCVEVLSKPLISRRLCPPSSDVYLVERES